MGWRRNQNNSSSGSNGLDKIVVGTCANKACNHKIKASEQKDMVIQSHWRFCNEACAKQAGAM